MLRTILLMLMASLSMFAHSEDVKELGTYTKIVHAKFVSINEHQTLTLQMEGRNYPVKIAYLRIPTKGEPYYEAARTVIDSYFKKSQWVQAHLTGQSFFNGTIAAFINNSDNNNLNSILLSEGLAILSSDAIMQEELIAISKKAANLNKGIWSSAEAYHALEVNPFKPVLDKFKADTDKAMSVVDKYVVVDIDKRTYHPGVCYPLFKMTGRNSVIYVDTERLDSLGYKKIAKCN